MRLVILLSLSLVFLTSKAELSHDQVLGKIQALELQVEEKKELYEDMQRLKKVYQKTVQKKAQKDYFDSENPYYYNTLKTSGALALAGLTVYSAYKYINDIARLQKKHAELILSGKAIGGKKDYIKLLKKNALFPISLLMAVAFSFYIDHYEDGFHDEFRAAFKSFYKKYQIKYKFETPKTLMTDEQKKEFTKALEGLEAHILDYYEPVIKELHFFDSVLEELKTSLEEDEKRLEKLEKAFVLGKL